MNANTKQIGGSHYRAELQHWDLVERYGVGYLEGCATKYLTRFEKKNGLQDLDKALHYAEKLLEMHREPLAVVAGHGSYERRFNRGPVPIEVISKFVVVNDVENTAAETAIIYLLRWQSETDLLVAIEAIKRAIIKYTAQISGVASSSLEIDHPAPFGYQPEIHG